MGLYAALRRSSPWSFWLDSADGPSPWGRWSFLGADPEEVLVWRGGRGVLMERRGRGGPVSGSPWDLLRRLARERWPALPAAGPPGVRALLLLAYELGFSAAGRGPMARRERELPDLVCLFFREGWTLDHLSGTLWAWREEEGLVRWREAGGGRPPAGPDGGAGRAPVSAQEAAGEAGSLPAGGAGGAEDGRGGRPGGAPGWSLDEDRFRAVVRTAKEYIAAGEIYQVNLSRRYLAPWRGDVLSLYRRLRAVNPEPFAGLVEGPGFAVASASPELFLRADSTGHVVTRPIKGTRPRSPDPRRDAALARELVASAKDRAELLMIVDLERNDLGRVCRPGSVRVPALFTLESHPAVHHLVATVEGVLRPDCDCADLLAAAFPGGSITGAPKIRAMEIIGELEPVDRGFYTGSMGFIGLDGSLELNILIRSCFFSGGWVRVHAGGGITAGSDPDAELAETEVKAASLLRCLAQAGQDRPGEAVLVRRGAAARPEDGTAAAPEGEETVVGRGDGRPA